MNESTEQFTQYRYRFDEAEFDESTLQLTVSGQLLTVEPRPLQVLTHLLRSAHEVVTKNELMEAVWDGRPTVDNVLANAINKLRRALGEPAGSRIVNVPRIGYKFTGPLDRLAVGSLPPQDLSLKPGMSVPGRTGYQLVRPLDAQGRGHVWLARQPKTGQERVFKFALDADTLRILKREYTLYRVLQQALPGRTDFVPVLDANFAEPPFYMECEYGGPDLLHWAQQDGRLAAMPMAERLALFVAIAQAVAAAHSVGILHRDLKPANVLMRRVGDNWLPAMADFGSAQPLDEARLREAGVTLMGMTVAADGSHPLLGSTLMYAAPELLAGGSATLQTDVYALGVLLYQVVRCDLRAPLTTGWQREVDDPLLVEDITAATEGQPGQRLASASELVQRLGALAHRRAQRLATQAEREQLVKTTLALQQRLARRPWVRLSTCLLLLGLGASLWMGLKTRDALIQAQSEEARVQKINDFLTQDVLRSASPSLATSGRQATIEEVLRSASKAAAQRFKNEPLIEASVRISLGEAFDKLAAVDELLAELRQAVSLRSAHLPADAPPVLQARLALVLALANAYRMDEAKAELAKAEALCTDTRLAADAELAISLAEAKATVFAQSFKNEEAMQQSLRRVQLLDALPDATSAANLNLRAMARQYLAFIYVRNNKLPEAEAKYLELLRRPYADVVPPLALASWRIGLAQARLAQGKFDGVEADLIAGRDEFRAKLGPANPVAAAAQMSLGELYSAQGRFVEAVAAQREAHRAFVAHQPDHPNGRIALLNLAIAQVDAGQAAEGLAGLVQGRAFFAAEAAGAESPVVQAIDFHRTRALIHLKRGREALALLPTLKPERLAEAEPGNWWPWRLQAEKGRALIVAGQAAQGQALLREAIHRLTELKASPPMLDSYRKAL